MAIADHPPHRSVHAELPHTAPTLDEWRRTWRTPPNPWDTRSPLWVGLVSGPAAFSLVCALSSTASAKAVASLFGCFTGTTAQSDSCRAYTSVVRPWAFTDRSACADAPQVSRFSCMLFRGVPGVFDYAGPGADSRSIAARQCGLPTDRTGSAPGSYVFGALYPRPPVPLSTLHPLPRGNRRKTRGQDGVASPFL
jgi:hypothetical protein